MRGEDCFRLARARRALRSLRCCVSKRRKTSSAMNVPLSDTIGLHIYRELMHREGRCAANWHVNYGPEALQKSPNPEAMVNLGLFSKFASVPMPLDVQRACSFTETVNARPCPNPLLSALTVCAQHTVSQSASCARRRRCRRETCRNTRSRSTRWRATFRSRSSRSNISVRRSGTRRKRRRRRRAPTSRGSRRSRRGRSGCGTSTISCTRRSRWARRAASRARM